jgi:aspartate aminotransferase
MATARIEAIARSTATLFDFVRVWDPLRTQPGILDFAFGNPQERPIPGLVEALQRHLPPVDKDSYAYHRSDPGAQAVVAKRLVEWRGLAFEPADIAITPGAFGAIAVALQALIDFGDEVVFSTPPWFFYEPMILAAGGVPVKVAVKADDYDLDLEAIASVLTPRTRMVIVNTPNNPTGRIYPESTLTALAELLTRAGEEFGAPIYLLSDEPYSRLVFSDATFTSPSAFYPYTLISYTYGKILLTPGQRLGWLALAPSMPGRPELRGMIEVAQMAGGWLFPNGLMQRALEDLEGLSIDLVELEHRRDLMAGELRGYGYSLHVPEGTFYLWVRSPHPDDFGFTMRLAERGVLVLPGSATQGPGHFRISLTASTEMVEKALPVFADLATQPQT